MNECKRTCRPAGSAALSCCLMWLPHESCRTNCMLQTAHEKFLAGGRARRSGDEDEVDEEEGYTLERVGSR